MSFCTIPVLDLSQARDPETKPAFLEELRHALLEVGFLYISNIGIDKALLQDVIREGISFFDLPEEKKLEVQMKNAPSFLGTTLGVSTSIDRADTHQFQVTTNWAARLLVIRSTGASR